MFHNIFSKKQAKQKEKIKPKIIADIHEKNSLVLSELIADKELDTEIKHLEIADYLIGNIAIERKTISDFISSMINRRLIEQLNQMKQYENRLLIIEGSLNDSDFNQNAVRGFILSILFNHSIPIIFTEDDLETAKYLAILAKQQLKPKSEISLHSRIPKTLSEQKQYILEAFPDIGPKTAKKLLDKFKTIERTINATEEELNEILKGKTQNFKKILKE